MSRECVREYIYVARTKRKWQHLTWIQNIIKHALRADLNNQMRPNWWHCIDTGNWTGVWRHCWARCKQHTGPWHRWEHLSVFRCLKTTPRKSFYWNLLKALWCQVRYAKHLHAPEDHVHVCLHIGHEKQGHANTTRWSNKRTRPNWIWWSIIDLFIIFKKNKECIKLSMVFFHVSNKFSQNIIKW